MMQDNALKSPIITESHTTTLKPPSPQALPDQVTGSHTIPDPQAPCLPRVTRGGGERGTSTVRPHLVHTCICVPPSCPHLHLCRAMAHDLAPHQLLPIRGGPHKVIRLITAQHTRSIHVFSSEGGSMGPIPIHFIDAAIERAGHLLVPVCTITCIET